MYAIRSYYGVFGRGGDIRRGVGNKGGLGVITSYSIHYTKLYDGILYADGRGIDLGEQLFDLQKLTARAAMAFEVLVLKNKILSL